MGAEQWLCTGMVWLPMCWEGAGCKAPGRGVGLAAKLQAGWLGDMTGCRLIWNAAASPTHTVDVQCIAGTPPCSIMLPLCCTGITPLFQAAKMGHVELVRALVKHGSLVNVPAGEQGLTALHWAAHTEMKEVALFLIENGADVLAKDKMERTPLSMATCELAEKMRGELFL